jgi:hypothetical protein
VAGDASTEATSNSNAEEIELNDYLENKGQWPVALVSDNKPNIKEILEGATDAPAAGGKGGKAPAKAAGEAITLDEGELEVPDEPSNNFYVGDAVEQIINLNFDARGKQLRPMNPHYLNLKLCFVGYAFAGKRLQAIKLKQEYGLDTFTLSDLVEEALKFFDENPNPIAKEVLLQASPIRESMHEDSMDMSKGNEDN